MSAATSRNSRARRATSASAARRSTISTPAWRATGSSAAIPIAASTTPLGPRWGTQRILQPFARTLDALGEPYRWLDAAELRKEVGTPYHSSALHTPGGRLFNPAGLTKGLADSLPENVTLHEHTPVSEIEQRNGVRAVTPGGRVDAKTMVLAVNGYAPQFSVFRRLLLPFASYGSLTRPLTEAEQAESSAASRTGG